MQTSFDSFGVPEQGENDFFVTPSEIVFRLVRAAPPPPDIPIVDPAAGNGALLQALREAGLHEHLRAVEIRASEEDALRKHTTSVQIADWFEVRKEYDDCSIVSNPPYSLLPEFAEACFMAPRGYLALLMPIEEMAGKQSTARMFRKHGPPDDLIPIAHRVWPNVRGVEVVPGCQLPWFASERREKRGLK